MTKHIAYILGLSVAITANTSWAEPGNFIPEDIAQPTANTAITGFIGIGAGVGPEFVGSEDYEAIPFIAGRVQQGNYYLELTGPGARANIIDSKTWNFGPVVRYRFERDDDIENNAVASLGEVDSAIEAGAFLKYNVQPNWQENDSASLSADILTDISNEHEGVIVNLQAAYGIRISPRINISADIGTTYASENFNETYFGVTPAGTIASGLSTFNPDGGFNSVTLGVNVQYALSPQWGIFSRGHISQLIGDAADSPIAEEDSQFLFGAGVSYRF